jgi:sterol desaturase/sphingolipid hydroxylase (fatty acid hydroxylase superfamily)
VIPNPGTIEFEIYKRQQAAISRQSLYRLSALYYGYAITISILALQSSHARIGCGFLVAGVAFWTFVEYLAHRFILHGRFPDGDEIVLVAAQRRYSFFLHGGFPYAERIVQHYFHMRLDPLHWEHHRNPYDGHHINAKWRDLLPLFCVTAPLSLIAPIYTLPVFLAGTVASYATEEWVHHSVHFYNFKNPYFRYLKRHHFSHHNPQGLEQGYGLTSAFWDMVFGTQLHGRITFAVFLRALRRKRREVDS